MFNEQDVKIAIALFIAFIIFFGALLFGLGYWVGSCDEPPAPPALLAPQNRDID